MVLFGAGLVLAGLMLPSAYGHEGATGVVKERMDLMESVGDATKTLSAMFKGERPYSAEEVRELSVKLEEHAGRIDELFPEGSDNPPSEAKPAIWSNWDEFKQSADDMAAAARALQQAAAERSEALPAFAKLGDSCESCHTDFRKEDD